MTERKTALTFEEKITAAFMHYVRQIDQQDIAMMYGVNIGRINEACNTIRKTLQPPGNAPEFKPHPDKGYEIMKAGHNG